MSATHAGSTSGGNLCHLLVRRARNLGMSKSVIPVVVMRLLSTVARGPRGATRISGLIPRRRRLHHIRNSNCRRPFSHPDTSASQSERAQDNPSRLAWPLWSDRRIQWVVLEAGHNTYEQVRIVFQWDHLITRPPFALARRDVGTGSIRAHRAFNRPKSTPLLEEERHTVRQTLVAHFVHPGLSHGTRAGAAFATDDQPVNARGTRGHSIRLLSSLHRPLPLDKHRSR